MIGLLGGTFDPIHHGHLNLALRLQQQLGLASVHLIASAHPPHRGQPQTSASHRYKMVCAAVQGQTGLIANDCELQRAEPSYMIDTLLTLRQQWGTQRPLALILGADAFQYFHRWHRWQDILQHCHLILVSRPGQFDLSDKQLDGELQRYLKKYLTDKVTDLHQHSQGLIYQHGLAGLDISATQIRQLLHQGERPSYLLPDTVLDYIQTHKLYRPAQRHRVILKKFIADLQKLASPQRRQSTLRFFKTGRGDYAEHDQFIGVSVPQQRQLLTRYQDQLQDDDLIQLLHSPIHEHRLCAILHWVNAYNRVDEQAQAEIFKQTWTYRRQINNWDLVDSYAPTILGKHGLTTEPLVLYQLLYSGELWLQRQAIVATFAFIKQQRFELTFQFARYLCDSQQDLLHKASGWMLREVGKQNKTALLNYLQQHHQIMPRIMLRYALEKMNSAEKHRLLT